MTRHYCASSMMTFATSLEIFAERDALRGITEALDGIEPPSPPRICYGRVELPRRISPAAPACNSAIMEKNKSETSLMTASDSWLGDTEPARVAGDLGSFISTSSPTNILNLLSVFL